MQTAFLILFFTNAWVQEKVENILKYERPDKYITNLKEPLKRGLIPVLTANKSFVIGYTNELNCFDRNCIIIDDFTLLNKYVNFKFLVKSSAIKILELRGENNNLFFIHRALNFHSLKSEGHNRHYIQKVQKLFLNIPEKEEQNKITYLIENIEKLTNIINRKIEILENIKNTLLNKMFADKTLFPVVRFKEFTHAWYQERVGNIIETYSIKNVYKEKLCSYSISNSLGFIEQKISFKNGGKAITADKSNSKIVFPNSFAFNPSRINIGSIGYYSGIKNILVSNIYEVFRANHVNDNYLFNWFKTQLFNKLIYQYLEGSVRNSLNIKSIENEFILLPNIQEQININGILHSLENTISIVKRK